MKSFDERLQDAVRLDSEERTDRRVFELLKGAHEDNLGPEYSLAYALQAMDGSEEDYEVAHEVFMTLYDRKYDGTNEQRLAAILEAYMYTVLVPHYPEFVYILSQYPDCSVCNYMLYKYYAWEDKLMIGREYLQKSLWLNHFPNNVLASLDILSEDEAMCTRQTLVFELPDLVTNKDSYPEAYEAELEKLTVHSVVRLYTDELVTGFSMQKERWEKLSKLYTTQK